MNDVQKIIYAILEPASADNKVSKAFDTFLLTLISLNVIAVILQTVKYFASNYSNWFYYFELFSVVVFSIEYILRVWTCTVNSKCKNPISGRLKFIFTPMALIDLLAILPFYLPMIIPFDLRFLRALRLVKLFRIFKVGRYSQSLQTLGSVIKSKKEELLISLFAVILLLIIASSLMFYVEHDVQNEAFSSIPHAMWWGVTTLSTVGYGDVSPITPLGKFLGAIIALLGIGTFALPAGILASGLAENIKKPKPIRNRPGKDILIAMDEHIHYELYMFYNVIKEYESLLNQHSGLDSSKFQTLKNALIESAGVHIRCLNHFFFGKSNRDNDILAEDFFNDPQIWYNARQKYYSKGQITRINNRVSREIVHLTSLRISIKHREWIDDWKSAYTDYNDLLKQFLSLVSDDLLGIKLSAEKQK